MKKWYQRNKDRLKKIQVNYAREHYLAINGKRVRVNKRPASDNCELCNIAENTLKKRLV